MSELAQRVADIDMLVRVNCFGDGMNEHIAGPTTVETAKELLHWADSYIFRQTMEYAEEIAEAKVRAESAEAKVLALQSRIAQLEARGSPRTIPHNGTINATEKANA